MIIFPNCKINLGLRITGKRTDGYHNIETIFYPVPLNDALEIIQATDTQAAAETTFTQTGTLVDGDEKDNLCIKAYHLLKKDFTQLSAVKIHLHKAIPMGAGLGGGSADAAFTLQLLNDKFNLQLSTDQLLSYALILGSDCPFFILNKPCYASGRGEIMEPINLDLTGYQLLVVNPGIHVNTGWAFAQLTLANNKTASSLQSIIAAPVASWKNELVNDFEQPVFRQHPTIADIKKELYQQGALYASMSGSGSTVYGLFEKIPDNSFHFPENYLVRRIAL
jgi:4-diphosphocytidyl-2-C-methyl-D-erythritol kinase